MPPSGTDSSASAAPVVIQQLQPPAIAEPSAHTRASSAQSRGSTNSVGNPQIPRQTPQNQRIGPYILGRTLGVGSTGRVKLGVHIETGHKVAIKIISKETLEPHSKNGKKSETNKKLEREITIMKLIQHPNVLQLYDVYETSKELFLVLEHVEGGELFDYLVKKGRLSEPEAVGFFQQIILGVEYCHRHLICHRDLKPENLLLDKDRNVKVADFGMASMQVPSKMLETSCGSPHYASPEIIKGVRYDGSSADVWSCGVILYALVTGNLPFDDENIRRLLNKVKTGMYFIPDYVGLEARDLIKRMLVVDPAKRISIKELMQHPWFLSHPIKNNIYYLSPLETASIANSIGDYLENDILDSLNLLGWNNNEALIASLKSPEPNPEKVFYNLLRKRKWEMFEHYDPEKLAVYDVEGGPRRRAESYSSVGSSDQRRVEETLTAVSATMATTTIASNGQSEYPATSATAATTAASIMATGMRKTAATSTPIEEIRKNKDLRPVEEVCRVEEQTDADKAQVISVSIANMNTAVVPPPPVVVAPAATSATSSSPTSASAGSPTTSATSATTSTSPSGVRRPVDHRTVRVMATNVRVNSPLSSSITAQAEQEAKDAAANESRDNSNIAIAPDVPAALIFSPQAAQSPGSTPSSVVNSLNLAHPMRTKTSSKKKPLTISIPGAPGSGTTAATAGGASTAPVGGPFSAGASGSSNGSASSTVSAAFAAIGLGTPKFHRKVFDAPQTPVISQTPKQSWFTNLFNFKPESFGLVSIKSSEETSATIFSILQSLEVKYQIRKDGLIKCKYDPSEPMSSARNTSPPMSPTEEKQDNQVALGDTLSPTTPGGGIGDIMLGSTTGTSPSADSPSSPAVQGKAVKFKIEMVAETVSIGGKEIFRIQLTQQQGAFSTFQSVVDRIQAEWTLDQ